jgi:predicted metal-dependent phosphoesterase TrpH
MEGKADVFSAKEDTSVAAELSAMADMHMHTIYSDGALSPFELIKRISNVGLGTISITDHDSVGAIDEAIALGNDLGVEVIPGVELSSNIGEKDIHILGYFVDYKDPQLLEYLSLFRGERLKRAEKIVAKLNHLQIPLKLETVLDRAGSGSVGRPHIAQALVTEGFIESYEQAFYKYIGVGCPAYEKKIHFSPEDAIALLASVGGLSFLAHPGKYTSDADIQRLIKHGLDGIEVIYPSHTPDRIRHYRMIAAEYFLLESGGSDFHGGMREDDHLIGAFTVPLEAVENMKRRLFQ